MDIEEVKKKSLALIERSRTVYVGTNGPDGRPWIKAMMNMKHDDLNTFWMTTNTSSKRVSQVRSDGKASIYYADQDTFEGLLLLGDMEVLQDKGSKELIWMPGFEVYYPKGVEDPDYSVLRFTAKTGNFYSNLSNDTFEI